jgi:UDP-3-O-[3-hydroxymyristoyl] N-acetylglucosamine deacetylase/3-hydroxyacyl-[acyl-carrier-protein] dehydratase
MLSQKTIGREVRLSGVGLHTGCEVNVILRPAPPDTGIVFVRTDLPESPQVEARVENIGSHPRRTSLVRGAAEVQTIEHLFSVLSVLRIQNLEVQIDGPELPGLDGSALPYYEALREAGVQDQSKRGREISLKEPVAVRDGSTNLVAINASDGLTVAYTLDYQSPLLETQFFQTTINEENFAREIAPARTFVLEHEIKELQARGLGKGANCQNTLVLGREGIIGSELRYKNEFVRHKILDLIGDLYLMGGQLNACVLATRSGHQHNLQLVKLILESTAREREVEGLLIAADRGLDIRQISKILPHRYPFLLVDRILHIDEGHSIEGIKNVTINEPFFQGHFPGHPIMPAVLIIEAMAQVGGLLLLHSIDDPHDKLLYFMGIDGARFRRPVTPGDQIRFRLTLLKLKGPISKMKGEAYVDDQLVAEAELLATVVDRRPA